MTTKKVRRRRQKLQRHEYEYVIETPEGEEVPVENPRTASGQKASAARDAKGEKAPLDRRGRPVQKPSLQRTLKRGLIFGPLIVIVAFLLGGNELTTAQKVSQAVILLAFFLPFSHLMDVLMYRAFQRRQAKQGPSGKT